ncbi:L-rhamnose mutarotase [Neobacillus muris]|uniref:L-rhamnose mutarotase n=1 Tax=Neobacillus muris TaxID=2941334 RepID=UPI0020402F0F|nr:L-rhamnose mutarotase [Neobacillus muris]
MIRKASIMYVNQDCYLEYKRRHDEIWPEMAAELKVHGARNYSIFLDRESGRLFAYLEIESEEKWENMSKTAVCQKWWAYMEPLMKTEPDNRPVTVDLEEVFFLA